MQISKPLSYNHNFCNSLSCPTAPTGMKYADVTPIHQKDDKTERSYCSVSILPNLSKVIDDGLMYNKIFPYFDLIRNNFP